MYGLTIKQTMDKLFADYSFQTIIKQLDDKILENPYSSVILEPKFLTKDYRKLHKAIQKFLKETTNRY